MPGIVAYKPNTLPWDSNREVELRAYRELHPFMPPHLMTGGGFRGGNPLTGVWGKIQGGLSKIPDILSTVERGVKVGNEVLKTGNAAYDLWNKVKQNNMVVD
jgi:hypothetical protein